MILLKRLLADHDRYTPNYIYIKTIWYI